MPGKEKSNTTRDVIRIKSPEKYLHFIPSTGLTKTKSKQRNKKEVLQTEKTDSYTNSKKTLVLNSTQKLTVFLTKADR